MLPLPSQIDRYEIKSLIGRGGMGDLYLARDPNTNRLVALKLLNATLDSSELRERFAREARALAALNHPNIVNIYDTGEFEDSPFIVMEYVRGETLAEIIKRRAALSVSEKLRLMEELCAGLAQAHEAGIIHRDIKPANLMMDQQGRLKILDFGIARVAEGHRTRVGLPLTQVNMTIGTPGYMSPEQIEDGEVDHRSDIFAVGAVCYELLSYHEAFSGTHTRQIENRILQTQPTPIASVVAGLDPEIDEIVLRALKKDPNKRYQDAATFQRALERLRTRLEPEIPGQAHRPTPPPPPSPRGSSPRAEAAYQRALVAYQGGAPEAARRFAVEALAEDPSHAGARALVARLDPRARRPAATVQSAAPPEPAALPTLVGTSVGPPSPTFAPSPTSISAPTIIVNPTDARPLARSKAGKGFPALWANGGPLKRGFERLWKKRDPAPGKRRAPFWTRYGRAAQVVALLVIVVGIAAAVIFLSRGLGPSGQQLLTITKPVGGTLFSAAGITCGTRGSDCSVTRPNGDAIELLPQADAGFAFVGYTGDCAPAGRTVMSTPRTCGATFDKEVASAGPPAGTKLLTIAPVPTGGLIWGLDIRCGTGESTCFTNAPDGVSVQLRSTPDPGYTFMGFTGDCVPVGLTQMTVPRTCSATFAPIPSVAGAPLIPLPRGAPGGRSGPGAAPPQPATGGTTASGPGPASGTPAAGGTGPSGGATSAAAAAPVTTVAGVPTLLRPPSPVSPKPVADAKPVTPPPTDEEYAKGQIQTVLKRYCEAYEALDPVAVRNVYPKVDMAQIRIQLDKSKYKSLQCKFADPVFLALDPVNGTASVKADVKRVFEHTAVKQAPQTQELVTTMTLSRKETRGAWLIDQVSYKEKPK